ncbi:MAG: NAD(P)H-hydrate epimerase [Chlorobi bacterium]|nr:NAD(P)H-hydrate epimerase [Chlorobiota bacterium]
MVFPEQILSNKTHIAISTFKEMDFSAIEKLGLPIELMMENAGLHLARLLASQSGKPGKILIGIGKGNNGGGGLVAARRLSAWGFDVYLYLPGDKLNELPKKQFNRAIAFGAKTTELNDSSVANIDCDIFVDAFMGFSQRLPIPGQIKQVLKIISTSGTKTISLDLPTGFNKDNMEMPFKPDTILTMAAMKTELIPLLCSTNIFIADIGIPASVYSEFGMEYPAQFTESGIVPKAVLSESKRTYKTFYLMC